MYRIGCTMRAHNDRVSYKLCVNNTISYIKDLHQRRNTDSIYLTLVSGIRLFAIYKKEGLFHEFNVDTFHKLHQRQCSVQGDTLTQM